METPLITSPNFKFFPFFKKSQASFVLFLLAVVFYSPSYTNEYALDDGIVIHQNSFVIKGIRGITDLLTKDTYHSFYERMNATDQLTGGRYRPLPAITYAIEQEIIGPYRSGFYMQTTDLNRNGILDKDPVYYTGSSGKPEINYEYNDYVDLNNDGLAQPSECYYCWDLNHNFANDVAEDINIDGVFNEIDCQNYGAETRHFNNILLYALCCLLLYQLLSRYLMTDKPDLAFLAALIFTIHPVHSEVVANVRGRDDMLSLIFILLTFIFALRYCDFRRWTDLILFVLWSFLALLSKEYALLLLFLLPLLLYFFRLDAFRLRSTLVLAAGFIISIVLMSFLDFRKLYAFENQLLNFALMALALTLAIFLLLFKSIRVNLSARLSFATGLSILLYLAFRLAAVNLAPILPDSEILNNPFLLATPEEALATKFFMLLKALGLQFWPHPLISDYSYQSVPYITAASLKFILAIAVHLFLLALAVFYTKRRHLLGFALWFYLLCMTVVSNLFFPTQIMFLESQLFHASLGFSIALAYLLLLPFEKSVPERLRTARSLMVLLLLILIIPAGVKTWERCKDWKNDVTLFLKDVNNAPNSVLVLGNAGARWIDLADTREITGISLPGQDTTRFNDYNGTLHISDEELQASGMKTRREAALKKGIAYLEHAVELHPKYVNGFLNLGLAYYKLADDQKIISNWKVAEALYPNNPYLLNYYQVYTNNLQQRGSEAFAKGDFKKALMEYNKWSLVQPENPDAWFNKGGAYFNLGQKEEAAACFSKARDLAPGETHYQQTMDSLNFPSPSSGKIVRKKGNNPC